MTETVTRIRFPKVLRSVGQILPLRHRLYPLIKHYSRMEGLLSVSWGKFQLVFPSNWPSFVVTGLVFQGQTLNPEFVLLREILRSLHPGIILDIGANIGCYVLEVRQYTKEPILAYEPAPEVFALLKRNVEINKLGDVCLRNVACGDTDGSISLEVSVNSVIAKSASAFGSSERVTSVAVTTLDGDLKSSQRISLMKIDCEGFEFHILAGAKKILKKHRPILLIELHPQDIARYGKKPADVCAALRPIYDLEFYDFNTARHQGRLGRFISRYRTNKGYRFSSEEEMLAEASRAPVPAQLYIVGHPKENS
jgi:FkbM family methyltransferase